MVRAAEDTDAILAAPVALTTAFPPNSRDRFAVDEGANLAVASALVGSDRTCGATTSIPKSATMVQAVLSLPCHETCTVSRNCRCAIHSRKAETATSRATMMIVAGATIGATAVN